VKGAQALGSLAVKGGRAVGNVAKNVATVATGGGSSDTTATAAQTGANTTAGQQQQQQADQQAIQAAAKQQQDLQSYIQNIEKSLAALKQTAGVK
jgi:uncharacterized FlaG/YvyC family protein